MKAVVTVIGVDAVGILAKVSTVCAENNANVLEVTQSVLQDYFAMAMLIDISELTTELHRLEDMIKEKLPDMDIRVMHEDIFNSMHRV